MDMERRQGTRAEQQEGAANSFTVFGADAGGEPSLPRLLLRSEQLATLGQVVAGIAHELNNPLMCVTGFADLLLRRRDLPEPVRDGLERIAAEAVRCGTLVRSLLSSVRDHEPAWGPVHLHDVLRETLELLAYRLRATGVQIVEDYAPDLPAVHGDAHRLRQVFLNLVVNAQQAMEGRPEKRLSILTRAAIEPERDGRSDHRAVRIVVRDTGPGIPPGLIEKIFVPFFTTKEPGKGTGLGLSVSRSIVEAHGGRLYAESEVGKGASFIVELPVHRGTAVPERGMTHGDDSKSRPHSGL